MDATTHVRVGPDTAVSAVLTGFPGDHGRRALVDAIRISDPGATGSYLYLVVRDAATAHRIEAAARAVREALTEGTGL